MIPETPETIRIARRVIWFEPPEQAIRDWVKLLTYAFRYATAQDMATLRALLGDNVLREAIERAHPGIIDPRSWSYWRLMLDLPPKPLPQRRFE